MKSKIYFNSIDAFRAIAALIVVIGHIELVKNQNGLLSWTKNVPDAHLGVVFFFVLSGYLITRLLLIEKDTTKTISIKKFYIRRILRIWPLYYLVLILSALILNFDPSWRTIILCFTFFPNIAHIIGSYWVASPQVWSIGVEEQFYLIWPMFFKTYKKNIIPVLAIFIIVYTFIPNIIWLSIKNTSITHAWFMKPVFFFFFTAKFNCMAWGALLAFLEFNHNFMIKILKNSKLFISLIFVLFFIWIFRIEIPYFTDELFAFFTGLVIIITVDKKYYLFNNKLLSFLGQISYGIYMYHWIVLQLIIPYFAKNENSNYIFIKNGVIYILSIGLTILLATISYYVFERYFLKLKNKIFSVI